MSPSIRKAVVIVLFGIIFLGGAWLAKTQMSAPAPQEKTKLRLGYNAESVNHAPVMVAYEKGFFDKNNIQVELISLGREVNRGLAVGQIDLGSAGITNFLTPIAKGAPMKVISASTSSPTKVFVRPDGTVKKIADLVGKKVGVDTGSSDALGILYVLKAENIDSSQIEFVDIAKSVRPQGLMLNKAIDAAVAGEFEDEVYQQAGAIILPEWQEKGYEKKSFPRTVIAAYGPSLASMPEAMEGFIKALIDSEKFIHDNPVESSEIVAKHIADRVSGSNTFTPEGIRESWQVLRYDLWYPDNVFQDLADISHEVGITERPLKLDDFFDRRFNNLLQPAQQLLYGTE